MKLNNHQLEIYDALKKGNNLKIKALPFSGRKTVIFESAKKLNKQLLYIYYNNFNIDTVSEKFKNFKENVTIISLEAIIYENFELSKFDIICFDNVNFLQSNFLIIKALKRIRDTLFKCFPKDYLSFLKEDIQCQKNCNDSHSRVQFIFCASFENSLISKKNKSKKSLHNVFSLLDDLIYFSDKNFSEINLLENYIFSNNDLKFISKIYPENIKLCSSKITIDKIKLTKLEPETNVINQQTNFVEGSKVKMEQPLFKVNAHPQTTVFKAFVSKSVFDKEEFTIAYKSLLEIFGLIDNDLVIVYQGNEESFCDKIKAQFDKGNCLMIEKISFKTTNFTNKSFFNFNNEWMALLNDSLTIKNITEQVEAHNKQKFVGLKIARKNFENAVDANIKDPLSFYSKIIEFYLYISFEKVKTQQQQFSTINQAHFNQYSFNFEEDIILFFKIFDESKNYVGRYSDSYTINKDYLSIKSFLKNQSNDIEDVLIETFREVNKIKNVFLQSSNIKYHEKADFELSKIIIKCEPDFVDEHENIIYELKINKEKPQKSRRTKKAKGIIDNNDIKMNEISDSNKQRAILQLLFYSINSFASEQNNKHNKSTLYLVELFKSVIYSIKFKQTLKVEHLKNLLNSHCMRYVINYFWYEKNYQNSKKPGILIKE